MIHHDIDISNNVVISNNSVHDYVHIENNHVDFDLSNNNVNNTVNDNNENHDFVYASDDNVNSIVNDSNVNSVNNDHVSYDSEVNDHINDHVNNNHVNSTESDSGDVSEGYPIETDNNCNMNINSTSSLSDNTYFWDQNESNNSTKAEYKNKHV